MTVDSTIHCHRCGSIAESSRPVVQPPELADEIGRKVCTACWREWEAAEVMVINEMHLNFMDPRATEVLEHNLREFLRLDLDPPSGEASD